MPDTLAASFDAFEAIRLLARDGEDRVPGLLATFMTAADAAVDGREAITIAPSLPPPDRGHAPVSVCGAGADAPDITGEYTKVCGGLDELEAFARELGGAARPCGLCLRWPARGTKVAGGNRSPYVDAGVAAAVVARAEALGYHSAKPRRLTEELNDNYTKGKTYAAHALLRTILDHIPPLPGGQEFQAVAGNHAWSRTDGSYARKLQAFRHSG